MYMFAFCLLSSPPPSEVARAQFASVVMARIAEREEKLGFELDQEDIVQMVKALRVTYCGPEGMIGPC